MASKEKLNSLSAKAKIVCGECDKPAKMNCTDCSELFLCGDCCFMKHKINPLTKDHEITSIAYMRYKNVSGNPSIHKSKSTDTKAAGDVQGKTRKLDSRKLLT